MGKVQHHQGTTPETMNRKKKGRPFKNPSPKPPIPNLTGRRSTRRNPNSPEFDADDDDERKEKKVKLVVRLPQSDDKSSEKLNSRDLDSGSGSDSEPASGDREAVAKKRKVGGGFEDGGLDQVRDVAKATDTPLLESPLESGPTTPLPDKKLLVFILDRLQKKDTYGVFSEPVDPNELPDYFEIIEQPMDFGTVRKKLGDGTYKNLEELEADVFLICLNAMKFNAPDTVYHRQARSIQELASRDFKNLRHEGDDGELQPKVVRRGRPPSSKNNQKKSLETSPVNRIGTDISYGATLANEEDKLTGSNSYNLRKGSALHRFRSTDSFVSSYSTRNGENEWSIDWNNEFPASILRADMKHTKKQFTVDENRRDTYRQFLLSSGNNSPLMSNSIGNMKRLVPMGLHEALACARSLARYAANLGPVAWKTASKKIETALPPGVKYGPGWVGDNGTPSQPPLSFPTDEQKPSISNLSSSAIPRGPPEGTAAGQGDNDSSRRTQFPTQQKPINGFTGMFGYNLSAVAKEQAELQKRRAPSPPPDLNVRVVPTGSPSSSSLQISSPKQPDHLELQL